MAPPRRRLWQEALLLLISAGIHSANSSPETYSFEPERRSFIQTDTARAAGLLASDVGRNSSQPHNRLDLRSSWEDASCTASVPRQTHMDVVIPFYEKELCAVTYQLRLLLAKDQENLVNDIFMVWAGQPLNYHQEHVQGILDDLQNLAHNYSKSIIFLEASEVLPAREGQAPNREHGWRIQQLVKLYVARRVSTSYYLVLDVKNMPIQNLYRTDFFSESSNLAFYNDVSFLRDGAPKNHLWLFGVEVTMQAAARLNYTLQPEDPITRSTTPFVFHGQAVLQLLDYIETLLQNASTTTGGDVYAFIFGEASVEKRNTWAVERHYPNAYNQTSEFALYHVFLLKQAKLRCFYDTGRPIKAVTLWNLSDEENIEEVLNLLERVRKGLNTNTKFFGVHKNISPSNKYLRSRILDLFRRLGAWKKSDDRAILPPGCMPVAKETHDHSPNDLLHLAHGSSFSATPGNTPVCPRVHVPMNRVDVVIIFTQQELCVLEYQLRGLIKHDSFRMVDGIHLFWGDQSDFRPHKKRLDLLIEELDQSANTGGKYITIATNLLPQSELWDVGGNSFTLREVSYLYAATRVKSSYYMVLQSSDIPLNTLRLSEFVNPVRHTSTT
mmetsp:Transcript_4274/g.15384  ORF Transcript_4274/g.15384 Transcript_4274/m.15384 type:complete len:611 (-) Transcript_4274:877-2709(-)